VNLIRFISSDGTRVVAVNPAYVVAVRDTSCRGKVETVIRTTTTVEMVGETADIVIDRLLGVEGDTDER